MPSLRRRNFQYEHQRPILDHIPTRKEEIPIQAEARCTIGFSQTFPALPIICRNDMPVNIMKKITENASDVARNAGATVGGAANTELGVFGVNTEASITSKLYHIYNNQGRKITYCKEARLKATYKLGFLNCSAWYTTLWLSELLIIHSKHRDLPSNPISILGPSTT